MTLHSLHSELVCPGVRSARLTSLAIVVTGDAPPSEFQIFAAGQIETTKGTFTFDALAASKVMAEYEAHGIDLMIDYDHASLSSLTLDPAQSSKAAGWFNIELRNGALWAVNVRWTPPAAEALARKEWRFMSPAFATDDGKITGLLNVAITNLPATRGLKPLMAASGKDNGMTIEEFLKVCKALEIDPTTSLDDAMKKIQGGSGDPDASTEDAPPPAGDGGADEATETAAEMPPPAAPADDKKKEVAASASFLMRLTGADSFGAVIGIVETWRASHLELETERQKLAADRATLESSERRAGCAKLVTQAGRAPATVWADDTAKAPKKYLAAMSIADFRDYVADAIKAHGKPAAVKPPATTSAGGTHNLTAAQLAYCAEYKCDPATFARLTAKPEVK